MLLPHRLLYCHRYPGVYRLPVYHAGRVRDGQAQHDPDVSAGVGGYWRVFCGLDRSTTRVLESGVNYETLTRITAPIIEEILKALILIYLIQHPRFRYIVDGAVYGIAVGIGFALSENLFIYLPGAGDAVLVTAISRTLSTSLMHATASGLVGISLGRLRRVHGPARRASAAGRDRAGDCRACRLQQCRQRTGRRAAAAGRDRDRHGRRGFDRAGRSARD